jgi:hypothetical protein
MSDETHHEPDRGTLAPDDESRDQSFWDCYWERFRRQDVDDPVEQRREGLWDRFRRQDVDDPVDERRSRG